MAELCVADEQDRESLGAFTARAVRLDGHSVLRLRGRDAGTVEAWVATPFDVLATRVVPGQVTPWDVTVSANELLAALTVAGGPRMDPGPIQDLMWRSELPLSAGGWQVLEELPATVVSDLAERGIAVAKDNVGPLGTPPSSLLDQHVLTVSADNHEINVPMRCLFALTGMGFLGPAVDDDVVRVAVTDGWIRMDARYGAVLRRRHALLPLLL